MVVAAVEVAGEWGRLGSGCRRSLGRDEKDAVVVGRGDVKER